MTTTTEGAPIKTYAKDPDATLDYTIDWTRWLVGGDLIATSEWFADTGITIEDDQLDPSKTKTTVWLSAGTAGESYRVTNRIVTNGGRTDDRSILIKVKDR